MRSHLISIALATVLALPAAAQVTGFTFDTPPGWKTVYTGGNTHMITPDGSRYMVLWSKHVDATPDVLRSAAVKNIAQQLATPLLRSMTFLGGNTVKVDGGSAAFFRFQGQASARNAPGEVIVPVWVAVADSGEGVAIVPEGGAPPDQSQELTELFRSLRFTHGGGSVAKAPTGRMHRTVRIRPVVEVERYEGRLYRDDRQFALSLHADGTASAEWKRPNRATEVLKGRWYGQDGNYTVRLNNGLALDLERNGPREAGFMNYAGRRDPIVALNMVSIPVRGTVADMYRVMSR